jgi:hypothetical protein
MKTPFSRADLSLTSICGSFAIPRKNGARYWTGCVAMAKTLERHSDIGFVGVRQGEFHVYFSRRLAEKGPFASITVFRTLKPLC